MVIDVILDLNQGLGKSMIRVGMALGLIRLGNYLCVRTGAAKYAHLCLASYTCAVPGVTDPHSG